jgi:hypothetical protein
MAQITLTKKQLDKFATFMRKHDVSEWFMAKDQGAYIGANAGSWKDNTLEKCIFYFKGCNPHKDDDAWHNARVKFGGDDFGEYFSPSVVYELSDNPKTHSMTLIVNDKTMEIKSKVYS